MSEPIWEPTEDEINTAKMGLTLQKDSLTEEDFFHNTVMVIATLQAQVRFLRNILHKGMNDAQGNNSED